MSSLGQIQDVPLRNTILLVGPPGAGKSTFCYRTVLHSLVMDTPIIYVTTEYGSSDAEVRLRELGLGEVEPGLLNFVDAYHETVGLSVSDRFDTIHAHCEDLSSISVAISKLRDRIGKRNVLLIFDSLTSPYLFSGSEALRFVRMTLSRLAAEGNSVLACIDEGCGKEEDLVAMMSLSSGVIKMEVEEGRRVLNVVKHPKVEPTRIEVPTAKIRERKIWDQRFWDKEMMGSYYSARAGRIRSELGDYVNLFWPNFALWSGMLWDPVRFAEMRYELAKRDSSVFRQAVSLFPWRVRFLFTLVDRLYLPKSFSRVKDVRKLLKFLQLMDRSAVFGRERVGILEYLEDVSRTDEHYFRVFECSDCWGFENVGATMASFLPPTIAGFCEGLEKEERNLNVVETKCIGLGDPYCEFKLVPGEADESMASLEKDVSVLESINDRLMHRLMGFLLEGKPLFERPRLGSDIYLWPASSAMFTPAVVAERYRMALRMGGARAGKEVGERLMGSEIGENEAVKRVLDFLGHCKVGKVRIGETIRIVENCESASAKCYTTKWEEPCCFFTTGFLNGFFSAVRNERVKETKCIGMGDPYCEWEFM